MCFFVMCKLKYCGWGVEMQNGRSHQFPDEDRDGPWKVGLLTIQPPDAAASPRVFYQI
jgi:hypothetical protein